METQASLKNAFSLTLQIPNLDLNLFQNGVQPAELNSQIENYYDPWKEIANLKLPGLTPKRWVIAGMSWSKRQEKIISITAQSTEHEKDVLREMYQNRSESIRMVSTINTMFIGSFSKTIDFVKVLMGEIWGNTNIKKDWRSWTPDPYLRENISNTYNFYNNHQTSGQSKWLVGPDDDGLLNWNSIKWFAESIKTGLIDKTEYLFSIYEKTEFTPDDYSLDRLTHDYLAIFASFLSIQVGGSSTFKLIWPTNRQTNAIFTLLGILYGRIKLYQSKDTPPAVPVVYVFCQDRKPDLDRELLSYMIDPSNFENIINVLGSYNHFTFNQYFDNRKDSNLRDIREMTRMWDLL
tara:strand:+ start:60147 stop:61193 length:1047 start_codon:yes stop_codon:yes gene_type:complete